MAIDDSHIPYKMEEPPSGIMEDEQLLREYLSRELKRIENSMIGVDLDAESRWDDLRVPVELANALGAGGDPNYAALLTDGAGSQGVYVYKFDPTVEEELCFNLQLPHGYKEGSIIRPHLHWTTEVTSASGLAVVWGLEYTYSNLDGTFGNTRHLTVTATCGTVLQHRLSKFGDLTASDATMSTQFLCRVYRQAAASNDTYTADASLIEIDFHIQLDSHGSRKEYTK